MAHSIPLSTPQTGDDSLRSYSMLSTAPGPLVRAGDFLRLNATSTNASATLVLNGRLLRMDGEVIPFFLTMPITVAGDQTARAVGLTDGWIIGFTVYPSAGTIAEGEIAASVEVVQASGTGATRVMCLASGDVTNTRQLGLGAFAEAYSLNSYPTTAILGANAAQPALGVNITITVPASQVWELLGLSTYIETDATVTNRYAELQFTNAAGMFLNYMLATAIPASQSPGLEWYAGYSPSVAGLVLIQGGFPPGIMLRAGDIIKVTAVNFRPTDRFGAADYSYRKWVA